MLNANLCDWTSISNWCSCTQLQQNVAAVPKSFLLQYTMLFICLAIYHLSSTHETICELEVVSSKVLKNYPMVTFWNRSCYWDVDLTGFRGPISRNVVCWFFCCILFLKSHLDLPCTPHHTHIHIHTHEGNWFCLGLNDVFPFPDLRRCQSFAKDSHSNWVGEHSVDWIQICAGEVEQG